MWPEGNQCIIVRMVKSLTQTVIFIAANIEMKIRMQSLCYDEGDEKMRRRDSKSTPARLAILDLYRLLLF